VDPTSSLRLRYTNSRVQIQVVAAAVVALALFAVRVFEDEREGVRRVAPVDPDLQDPVGLAFLLLNQGEGGGDVQAAQVEPVLVSLHDFHRPRVVLFLLRGEPDGHAQ
jgi:hypothetical protein